MTYGQEIKATFDSQILKNPQIATTGTHTPRTENALTNFGYSGTAHASGTATGIYIVPYRLFKPKISFQSFGNFETGDLSMAVSTDYTINTSDLIMINSVDYIVEEIHPIILNNSTIANILSLIKE